VRRRAFNNLRRKTAAAKHVTVVSAYGASRNQAMAAVCKATDADQFLDQEDWFEGRELDASGLLSFLTISEFRFSDH